MDDEQVWETIFNQVVFDVSVLIHGEPDGATQINQRLVRGALLSRCLDQHIRGQVDCAVSNALSEAAKGKP